MPKLKVYIPKSWLMQGLMRDNGGKLCDLRESSEAQKGSPVAALARLFK